MNNSLHTDPRQHGVGRLPSGIQDRADKGRADANLLRERSLSAGFPAGMTETAEDIHWMNFLLHFRLPFC